MASQHILSGPELLTSIPDTCLGKYLYQCLLDHGNTVAMVDAVTGETRTFSDILTRSLSVAKCLLARGVKTGDVVAICSENNLDFVLPVLGAYYIGATCAPLNPDYTTRELLHAMNISKPRIIFCSEKALEQVDKASSQVKFLNEIVVFGLPLSHTQSSFTNFTQDRSCSFQPLDVDYKSLIAGILCSSGTTGLPKGVMLSQLNLLTVLEQRKDPRVAGLKPDDVALGLLPMFHSYAFVCQIITIALGTKVVVMNKFQEELFLQSIQNHKITLLFLVPPLVVFLAKAEIVDKYDLSSLRTIRCGAAPLSEEIETLVSKRLGVGPVRQGYGMTETTLGVIVTPPNENKSGSSGILVAGTQCKVVDLETGGNLGPYKKGELCFKGPLIMKGYCGDLQATSSTFDSEGFLHTGDVGYYDKDGYFFIVDRVKELIKYKGFQVPPAELEAVLLSHPAIKDAGVIGIPNEEAGELPLAFVVKQIGASVTEEEIIKYVADQVSPQKRLRGGVLFVDSVPKTASGKILRRELRTMMKSKL